MAQAAGGSEIITSVAGDEKEQLSASGSMPRARSRKASAVSSMSSPDPFSATSAELASLGGGEVASSDEADFNILQQCFTRDQQELFQKACDELAQGNIVPFANAFPILIDQIVEQGQEKEAAVVFSKLLFYAYRRSLRDDFYKYFSDVPQFLVKPFDELVIPYSRSVESIKASLTLFLVTTKKSPTEPITSLDLSQFCLIIQKVFSEEIVDQELVNAIKETFDSLLYRRVTRPLNHILLVPDQLLRADLLCKLTSSKLLENEEKAAEDTFGIFCTLAESCDVKLQPQMTNIACKLLKEIYREGYKAAFNKFKEMLPPTIKNSVFEKLNIPLAGKSAAAAESGSGAPTAGGLHTMLDDPYLARARSAPGGSLAFVMQNLGGKDQLQATSISKLAAKRSNSGSVTVPVSTSSEVFQEPASYAPLFSTSELATASTGTLGASSAQTDSSLATSSSLPVIPAPS